MPIIHVIKFINRFLVHIIHAANFLSMRFLSRHMVRVTNNLITFAMIFTNSIL